jgi:hypothetical protein
MKKTTFLDFASATDRHLKITSETKSRCRSSLIMGTFLAARAEGAAKHLGPFPRPHTSALL